MGDDDTGGVWTVADVAAACGITRSTVYAYRRDGKLPPARMIGRTPVWDPGDIQAWKTTRRGPGRPRRTPPTSTTPPAPTVDLAEQIEALIDALGARRALEGQWPTPHVRAELVRRARTVLIVTNPEKNTIQLHLARRPRGRDQLITDTIHDYQPSEIAQARDDAQRYLRAR